MRIGKSVPRVDAQEKVTGRAVYCADIKLPGMLTCKIKRNPYPSARILSIDTSKALRLPGVKAVITAQDVTQFQYGNFVIDELPLAEKFARYVGDEVAAVAAIDAEIAEEALDLIKVDYEELPAVLDVETAMEPGALAVHPELEQVKRNIAYHIDFVRGDGEAAFRAANVVVEDQFFAPGQYHTPLETQSCVAYWYSYNKVTIWASTQTPFRVRRSLARTLGIPEYCIRIIQPHVGGGFGGKGTMLPHLPISALLSKAAGKPVRIVYTRTEDFIASRPRESQIIDLRLGFKRDGTMIAKSARITVDAGAYCGITPTLLTTSAIRHDCVYRLANIKTVGNVVYTNKVPRGPMRGFGNTGMIFAMESLIDVAANELGIDPTELRLKNCTHKGDVTTHGWIINSCSLSEAIRSVAKASDWKNKRGKGKNNYGIGIACQVHVSGNRGVDPLYDGSAAIVSVDQYGKVRVISGESEIGQGINTIFAQIAAEELGVKDEDVEVMPVDSDYSPFCQGVWSSRGTTIGGNAVLEAARNARMQLLRHAANRLGLNADQLDIRNGKFYVRGGQKEIATVSEIAHHTIYGKLGGLPISGRGEYLVPDYVIMPDRQTLYGNYSIGYSFSAQVAEVLVDPETGKVDVLNIWVGQDVGKALNPKGCEGQVEGGVVMGMGYALGEEYLWKEGRILNPNLTDYKVPQFTNTGIHTILIESNEPGGPYGAKGIGEAASNPTHAAIANAVCNAVGIRIRQLPITPEKLLTALRNQQI